MRPVLPSGPIDTVGTTDTGLWRREGNAWLAAKGRELLGEYLKLSPTTVQRTSPPLTAGQVHPVSVG